MNIATVNNRAHHPYAVRPSVMRTAIFLIGLCCITAWIGYETDGDPLAAGLLVAFFLCVVLLILVDFSQLTLVLLATLPWLVMLDTLIPKLTLTFVATGSVFFLLLLKPRFRISGLQWIGPALLSLVLLAASLESGASEQFIEAAKYIIFPAMALVVASPPNCVWLKNRRQLLLYSGVAAMTAQIAIIFLHLGSAGTKYGVGEQLGFATQNPHELALIGATLGVACLVAIRDVRWRLAGATLSLAPALATGVRSALVGIAIALLILAIRARLKPSVLLGILALCAVIVASGVGTIIVTRFQQGQAKGEFSAVDTAGSGRGGIWTIVLSRWNDDGLGRLLIGNGLRSVERFEEQALTRKAFVAQSDLVGVLVEFGIVGLVAWLLTWLTVLKSQVEWIILLPLAIYALVNGSLEYVGATVFCIALAAACVSSRGASNNIALNRPPKSLVVGLEPSRRLLS